MPSHSGFGAGAGPLEGIFRCQRPAAALMTPATAARLTSSLDYVQAWARSFRQDARYEPRPFIRIPGEGLGLDSCAVAKRVGWCAMSRGGRLWRGLLLI